MGTKREGHGNKYEKKRGRKDKIIINVSVSFCVLCVGSFTLNLTNRPKTTEPFIHFVVVVVFGNIGRYKSKEKAFVK